MSIDGPLPFLMHTEEELPKFRAATFFTKEPETIKWLDDNLKNCSTPALFIDIGANIGIYSLYAASINRKVSIVAVEPIDANVTELNRNVILNGFSNSISVTHLALSDISCRGLMQISDERIGSSGAQILKSADSEDGATIVLTGDELVSNLMRENDQTWTTIMLKVDTDGNELDVLRGFEQCFSKSLVSTCLCETHPSNRVGIGRFMSDHKLSENFGYLNLTGHSNLRRIEKGRSERTKIYCSATWRPNIQSE